MISFLLALHGFTTLSMVGIIWFVQVVHYPLFREVDRVNFPGYEKLHQERTSRIVGPLMLSEAICAVLLVWASPPGVAPILLWVGLLLVALVWASTWLIQVPAHARLSVRFDEPTHRWLVRSNWLRTCSWTLRGVLVSVLVA